MQIKIVGLHKNIAREIKNIMVKLTITYETGKGRRIG